MSDQEDIASSVITEALRMGPFLFRSARGTTCRS